MRFMSNNLLTQEYQSFQKLHGGSALYVSFVDYLAGRKSNIYWPVLPPTYQKKEEERRKIGVLYAQMRGIGE
jgi:hypothetical protein